MSESVGGGVGPAFSALPGKADAHVALRQVTRVFDVETGPSLHALGPIDLSLRQGEFFSVVGPSGCGKSTLLECIAGLSEPSDGEIMFEGAAISGKVPRGVGVVFQEDASFPWLTVWENVAFGLRQMPEISADVLRERVDYAISFMGLAKFSRVYPAQLSGGMRQRVCIARTLVMQPRLILLDEPFGALDQQTRLLMGDELLRLWRETNATILLITHSLDEATMLSDRIGVMSARPGILIDVVETNWSRDRDSRIAADPAFGGVTARLWSRLRVESIKSMSEGSSA